MSEELSSLSSSSTWVPIFDSSSPPPDGMGQAESCWTAGVQPPGQAHPQSSTVLLWLDPRQDRADSDSHSASRSNPPELTSTAAATAHHAHTSTQTTTNHHQDYDHRPHSSPKVAVDLPPDDHHNMEAQVPKQHSLLKHLFFHHQHKHHHHHQAQHHPPSSPPRRHHHHTLSPAISHEEDQNGGPTTQAPHRTRRRHSGHHTHTATDATTATEGREDHAPHEPQHPPPLSTDHPPLTAGLQRHGPYYWWTRAGHQVAHWFQALDQALFPRSPLHDELVQRQTVQQPHHHRRAAHHQQPVWLYGCSTAQEHQDCIRQCLERGRNLHGAHGLQVCANLEYRFVPCWEHQPPSSSSLPTSSITAAATTTHDVVLPNQCHPDEEASHAIQEPRLQEGHQANTQPADQHSVVVLVPLTDTHILAEPAGLLHPSPSQVDLLSACSGRWSIGTNAPEEEDDLEEARQEAALEQLIISEESKSLLMLGGTEKTVEMAEGSAGTPLCHACTHRLFHRGSNTMIDAHNRTQFIADGDMYELVARLCQEYALDLMFQDAQLTWLRIPPVMSESSSPTSAAAHDSHRSRRRDKAAHDGTNESTNLDVRTVVNLQHPLLNIDPDDVLDTEREDQDPISCRTAQNATWHDRPTLLISTGRGKVRAGIFSRQHLIESGVETATAWPIIREAQRRQLNVMLMDPNVHGEQHGFTVFQQTLDYYWDRLSVDSSESDAAHCRDLYILSHSASGGHLARYLLDKSESILPHICAVAFTDSTHNIQWAKKSTSNPDLYHMLESDKCVYFRCSQLPRDTNSDSSKWYLHSAGEQVQTDSFWKHRFGEIRTYWAGTNEHSLTNWYAHAKIWEHFDQFLSSTTM